MSSSAVVMKAAAVAKSYRIYGHPRDRLKQFLWRGRRIYFRDFWALYPLSFELHRGECVGFVGRNGSGKSTLLQIVAGLVTPTAGDVETTGRVSALLELGAGFNPEFTGRENAYLNGAILGLERSEIDRRFGAIESFAEIGDFIDQPVKTYSSGMYVRLAFAVAIHVDPDILVVDEALAVGDALFQYKCLRRLEELQQRGMSVIFVSHDLGAVKRFCNRAGWLNEGRLVSFGPAVEVANQYEDFLRQQMGAAENTVVPSAVSEPEGRPHARLLAAVLRSARGSATTAFVTGGELVLSIRYQVFVTPREGLVVGAAIFRNDGLYVCGVNTLLDHHAVPDSVGEHEVTLHYGQLGLLAGSYFFKVGVFDSTATVVWDFEHFISPFTVSAPYLAEGVVVLAHRWSNDR